MTDRTPLSTWIGRETKARFTAAARAHGLSESAWLKRLVEAALGTGSRSISADNEAGRRGRPATPMELLKHNCLTVASGPPPPDWWCFTGVNRNAPLPVRGTLRTDDVDTLFQAAVGGIGIVHLASWLVGDMVASGRLVSLFPEARTPQKDLSAIHAVRLPGRSHGAKAKLFITRLRAFGDPPYWERDLGKPQR